MSSGPQTACLACGARKLESPQAALADLPRSPPESEARKDVQGGPENGGADDGAAHGRGRGPEHPELDLRLPQQLHAQAHGAEASEVLLARRVVDAARQLPRPRLRWLQLRW